MGMFKRCIRFLPIIAFVSLSARAGQFHVTPDAAQGGTGSLANPWQLQAALQSPSVKPGDTIWVHGGTYANSHPGVFQFAWASTIGGASGNPIIVRAYPGDHPVLDGGDTRQADILNVKGGYVWFWGLEIMSSSLNRYSPSGGSFPPGSEIDRGTCVGITQDQTIAGGKIINCILHDGFVGYGNTSATSTSAELYGCLLYNNGWLASDRNHGHNIYIQNVAGSIREQNANIIWGAFENLIQAYGTHNTDDFSYDQNFVLAPVDGGFLVGGAQASNNLSMTNNCLYSGTFHAPLVDFGWNPYGAGLANATITGNYFGGGELKFQFPISGNVSGNTIYYQTLVGGSPADFPNNTWTSSRPTGTKIVVIPNKYEAGRANVAIYNWDDNSSVSVDLSGVFSSGDHYTIIDAENPAVTVASGAYSGPVSIPMTGLTAAQPVGQGTRTHTAPDFGAFIATGGSGTVTSPPPAVSTGGTGNITNSGAQLNGSVGPNGFSTTYHFEYGLTTTYDLSTPSTGVGSGTGTVSVNATLSGLTPGSVYHYRLVAANSGGTTNGTDRTFTTLIPPPAVSTGGVSNITTSGAQLNGSVNPNGFSTTYHFEYGVTITYGSSTQPAGAGSGTSAVSVSAALSALTSGSTYHYRLVAASSGGTTSGSDQTLTAGTAVTTTPTVSTGGASNITTTGAQINGSVNPNGFSTTYHFEYGLTTTYGSSTQPGNAGSGTGAVSVNATLSGLTPGSVCHYRLVAANTGGTTNGTDQTLTAGTPPPAVSTGGASSITTIGAQLNGSVNPNGVSTTYHFEYGLTTSYGSSTQSGSAGSGTVIVNVNATLSGLASGSVYHYRLVAASSGGTTGTGDTSFTTASIVRPAGLPITHSLEQNYPNPFNPETRIDYEIYVAADVNLKVYNALGVEVATLVSGVQTVGKHSVQWEAKGLVSGVYFCLLKSGGMVSSRRMIYVK